MLRAQASVPPANSPEDVTQYADTAAADPLSRSAPAYRAAAMRYVENDHTMHVLLCLPIFQQMNESRAPNAHEITLQYMISAASFLYQHPESKTDSNAQNTAGLASALTVYKKLLENNPRSRFKFLDGALKQQASTGLTDFVAQTCKTGS